MTDDALPDWHVRVLAAACDVDRDGPRSVYGAPSTDALDRVERIKNIFESIPNTTPPGNAIARASERIAAREERELRGAWRAGYDRVDVYDAEPGFGSGVGQITLGRRYVPRHAGEDRRDPSGWRYAFSYDLDSVPDDVILNAIRGDL